MEYPMGIDSMHQFRFDKWLMDTVHAKENPGCCHIVSYSLLLSDTMIQNT